jgi:hypothetical protein
MKNKFITRYMNNNAKKILAPKHLLAFPIQPKLPRWIAPLESHFHVDYNHIVITKYFANVEI